MDEFDSPSMDECDSPIMDDVESPEPMKRKRTITFAHDDAIRSFWNVTEYVEDGKVTSKSLLHLDEPLEEDPNNRYHHEENCVSRCVDYPEFKGRDGGAHDLSGAHNAYVRRCFSSKEAHPKEIPILVVLKDSWAEVVLEKKKEVWAEVDYHEKVIVARFRTEFPIKLCRLMRRFPGDEVMVFASNAACPQSSWTLFTKKGEPILRGEFSKLPSHMHVSEVMFTSDTMLTFELWNSAMHTTSLLEVEVDPF